MLPLEELRTKYIPIEDFPEKYNISVYTVMKLIHQHEIKYAEFKATPTARLRTIHANPEDVLRALEKGGE